MYVVVAGGGKVGYYLARSLLSDNHEVLIIERDRRRADSIAEDLGSVVLRGDACEASTLQEAGAARADVVVATTGDDEDNLVVAKLAKHEFRVGRVIARVNNPKNQWLFTQRMGVDIAISAAAMLARLIQEELTAGELVPLLKLAGGKASLVEFTVAPSSRTAGQRVDALELPTECVLVTVLREGQILIPRGDTTLQVDDRIIALIQTEQQPDLARIFG